MKFLMVTILLALSLGSAAQAGVDSSQTLDKSLFEFLLSVRTNDPGAVKVSSTVNEDMTTTTLALVNGANSLTCQQKQSATGDTISYSCNVVKEIKLPNKIN